MDEAQKVDKIKREILDEPKYLKQLTLAIIWLCGAWVLIVSVGAIFQILS